MAVWWVVVAGGVVTGAVVAGVVASWAVGILASAEHSGIVIWVFL